MKYVYGYEISALIFLIVIAWRFFSRRRFPTRQSNFFSAILIMGLLDLVLDMGSSLTIEYALYLPIWFTYLIDTLFYALQGFFPVLLLIFIYLIADDFDLKKNHSLCVLLIPFGFYVLELLANLFNGDIFIVDHINGFVRGEYFLYIYISAVFYMSLSYGALNKFRNKIKKLQYFILSAFVFIMLITILIQFLLPSYLLTGVAVVLVISMTYFTLQNPEDMLDSFTHTFNYEALLFFLECRIREKKNFQFIVIDIDGIRRVNNLFGVLTGNEVMAGVGNYFLNLAGKPWVFKMLGTRFMIVTFNQTQQEYILEDVARRFKHSWSVDDMHIMLMANIHYFSDSSMIHSVDDVLSLIELSAAKDGVIHDKVTVKTIDSEILSQIQRHRALEKALRKAIDEDLGFELYFQPIYAVKSRRFTSVEVLLRFSTPEFGSVSPAEFIPIAEKSGLILKIDEMVIRKTLEFMTRYNIREDFGLNSIEVNLSAAEFVNEGFFDRFINIYNKFNIDPTLLVFEITETVATTSYDMISEYMNLLDKLGIKFAIDDFGKGYANITQVVNLPFTMVKLDRSLLVSKNESLSKLIIFEDLLNMFRKIGMAIVVEGVETQEDVNQVIALKADYIQGYFYVKPMPEYRLIEFLTNTD